MPQRECGLSVFCVDVEGLLVRAVDDGFLLLLAQGSGPDKDCVERFEEGQLLKSAKSAVKGT